MNEPLSSYPAPQIGYYQAECCLLDLYKIETQDDLAAARDRAADCDGRGPLMVFATLAEAVACLRGELDAHVEQRELARLGWVDTERDG